MNSKLTIIVAIVIAVIFFLIALYNSREDFRKGAMHLGTTLFLLIICVSLGIFFSTVLTVNLVRN